MANEWILATNQYVMVHLYHLIQASAKSNNNPLTKANWDIHSSMTLSVGYPANIPTPLCASGWLPFGATNNQIGKSNSGQDSASLNAKLRIRLLPHKTWKSFTHTYCGCTSTLERICKSDLTCIQMGQNLVPLAVHIPEMTKVYSQPVVGMYPFLGWLLAWHAAIIMLFFNLRSLLDIIRYNQIITILHHQ